MNAFPPFTDSLKTKTNRLVDFSAQGLRLLIDQERSLQITVPLALDRLEENPLVGGESYAGDLLVSILQVSPNFWFQHPECHQRLENIISVLVLKHMNLSPQVGKALDSYYIWAGPLRVVSA
jgi:hypothetical protein